MRRTSPTVEAQAAAALAAGWPIVAVAEQFTLSLSTIKRIRMRAGVRLGSMRGELVDEYRAGLKASLSSEFAATEGARLVRAQVTLVDLAQTKAFELMEGLTVDEDCDRHQASKILAACTGTIKLAGDSLRRVLALAAQPETAEELPVLQVRDMLEEEIAKLREQQRQQAEQMGLVDEVEA